MSIEIYQHCENYSERIQELCLPLDRYFGIKLFGYAKIYYDKRYFFTSNNRQLTKELFENVTSTCIFSEKHTCGSGKYYATLWPKIPNHDMIAMAIYPKHLLWNGITLSRFKEDYVECWGFAADLSNVGIIDFYIKHIAVLEMFIEYFIGKTADDYTVFNNIKLARFSKFDFSTPHLDLFAEEKIRVEAFLREINTSGCELKSKGMILKLSGREYQCLSFLAKGFSAKVIGKELGLSPRTIETYINHVREKSGYRCKSDLIKCFYDNRGLH